jgi:transposase-like protein
MPATMTSPRGRRVARKYKRWTWQEKLNILEEVTQAQNAGEKGAVARICEEYGIKTNYLTNWRRQIARKS